MLKNLTVEIKGKKGTSRHRWGTKWWSYGRKWNILPKKEKHKSNLKSKVGHLIARNVEVCLTSNSLRVIWSIVFTTYLHGIYTLLPSIMSMRPSAVESHRRVTLALWILYSLHITFTAVSESRCVFATVDVKLIPHLSFLWMVKFGSWANTISPHNMPRLSLVFSNLHDNYMVIYSNTNPNPCWLRKKSYKNWK